MQSFLGFLFVAGVFALRKHVERDVEDIGRGVISFASDDAGGECSGSVAGEVPDDCGGKLLQGEGVPLACGQNGLTVKIQEGDGRHVVAKLVQPFSVSDNDEWLEEKAKANNECALLEFLEKQGAPNILRCEARCTGQLSMEIHGSHMLGTPVMITAPFVSDAVGAPAELGTNQSIENAIRQTVYVGAHMLAAGVVNEDLERNILYAPDGTTFFIDLGIAKLIYAGTLNSSWTELDLSEFRFMETEQPFKVHLSDAAAAVRTYIEILVRKSSPLEWNFIEEQWRSAWGNAAKTCTYKVEGLQEVADDTFYGLRLLEVAGYRNPTEDEAHPDMVKELLKSVGERSGSIWQKFKQEACDKAESAVELADEGFDNLQGFRDIRDMLRQV